MPELILISFIILAFLAGALALIICITRLIWWRTSGAGTRSLRIGLLAALSTALGIFILVYISAWAEMRQTIALGDFTLSGLQRMAYEFIQLRHALADFAKKNGHYPDTLGELDRKNPIPNLHDAWDNPYDYHRTDGGYRLMSLGRDGKPGGFGLDADIDSAIVDTDPGAVSLVEPTLSQFLFNSAGSGMLLKIALFAAACAGLAAYIASGPGHGQPVDRLTLVKTIVLAAIGALVVSGFLVMIYTVGEHH